MDIRQLINLLPNYYKEFDSYKVKGKGLLERFLELIGDTLYKVKEKIDTFLNVISVYTTSKENLDLLAKHLGGIPFTGSNSIESLKLTEKQRRDLIAMSMWFTKNRGSKEYFFALFKKLNNRENNLSITIEEKVSNQNLEVNIMDYYSETDSTSLDENYTSRGIPIVVYKVTGDIPKSAYKPICEVLNYYYPFNVVPLVYINNVFQSRLNLPYQLTIEYFDTVSKLWKTAKSTFDVGQNTNYFRVVAYNTETHQEVTGVRFTTKYESDNPDKFTGENTSNILVTPYYYEIDSLPLGVNTWTRTFIPVPTIPNSGEDIGSETKIKYAKVDNSLQYTDNITIKALFDTMQDTGHNTRSITKGKYHTSVVAITATRTYNKGIVRNVGVVNSNTNEVIWPTTVWFDKVNRKLSYSKPTSGVYEKLENVSIFHIFQESTTEFYSSLNKGTSIILKVENDNTVQPLQPGRILVREHGKGLPWSDSLVLNVQSESMNITMPYIDVLVLNPNLPTILFEDGTQLTPNDVISLLQGPGITYGTNTINNKIISSSPDNIYAFADWKNIMNNDTKWILSGTAITVDSWKNNDSQPITLPSFGEFTIMSKAHPTIINPAKVQCKLVYRTILSFYGYDSSTKYTTGDEGKATIFSKIRVDETNDPEFDLRNVPITITFPNTDKRTLTLNPDNPSILEVPEGSIIYEQVDENFNVVAINTNLKGTWTIALEDSEGFKVINFQVKPAEKPKPPLPEPYYLKLVPVAGTETADNPSWSTSDSYSSITMNNLDDSMMFQVEILDIDRGLLRQRYVIYITNPDDVTEEGYNQESYVFHKPGKYIFKVEDIVHTLEIRDGSTHLPDEIQPVVRSTPSRAVFDNTNGVLDLISMEGTNSDHYQYDPETGGIIINLSINTDQEWTATLENT